MRFLSNVLQQEDIALLKQYLNENKLDSSNLADITNKALYQQSKDSSDQLIVIKDYGVAYGNKVIKYNWEMSFSENLKLTVNKMNKKDKFSYLDILFSKANAKTVAKSKSDQEKEEKYQEIAGFGYIATFAALVVSAPKWVIASGIAGTVYYLGMSVAHSDEIKDKNYHLKNFECLPDGWGITLDDQSQILVVKNKRKNDDIVVKTIDKNGVEKIQAASEQQKLFFEVNQKACSSDGVELVKNVNSQIKKLTSSKMGLPAKSSDQSPQSNPKASATQKSNR